MPPKNDHVSAVEAAATGSIPRQEVDSLFEYLGHSRHLAIAVSGGSDSMALAVLVADWARRRGGPLLSALTVDHRLRPESAVEAAQVAAWCNRLGIAHHVLVWDAARPTRGIQAAAREARYSLIESWCVRNGADAVVVAHTLEDQAETVLMRLARGSGVDGLAAMAPLSRLDDLLVARPLLAVSKVRLEATLKAHGQEWIADPSNLDDRYERVRIRRAMALLEPLGLNRDALARTATRMASARSALDNEATRAMADCVAAFDAGFVAIDLEGLARHHRETRIRLLARCLRAVGGKPYAAGHEALERLDEQIRAGGSHARTLGRCEMRQSGGRLFVARETGRRSPAPARIAPGQQCVWDGRFRIAVGRHQRAAGLVLRALEAAGWQQVRDRKGRIPQLPAHVGRALVSVWRGDRLVEVPHLHPAGDGLLAAEFVDGWLLDGARRRSLATAAVTANLPHCLNIASTIANE